MNKICILGSINMDVVVKVNSMPKVGETIIGNNLMNIPGGKGANQAVAAKRSGASVYMLGKVGLDSNGNRLIEELKKDQINVDHIYKDESKPTGTAIITVDESGNNSIIVVPGANMRITQQELNMATEVIKSCNILIAQFETNMDIIIEAFKIAKEYGVITILNPAPAKQVPDELLQYIDVIVPNETEAFELTKVQVNDLKTAKESAEIFLNKGVKYVIVTMGEKGAALIGDEGCEIIPAYNVSAVDTTAAGDSFIGALASKLEGSDVNYDNLKSAVVFGNKVSSIAVQREGAQPSIPTVDEVMKIYKEA